MSQQKGKVPAHITPKSFEHPGASLQIVQTLSEVVGPRLYVSVQLGYHDKVYAALYWARFHPHK